MRGLGVDIFQFNSPQQIQKWKVGKIHKSLYLRPLELANRFDTLTTQRDKD
jgi:hypothetical protein